MYKKRVTSSTKIKYYDPIEAAMDKEAQYYNETMMANYLDKYEEKCRIYKKTINKMCDKFGIEHSEVFNIIDSIKSDKNNNNEREL